MTNEQVIKRINEIREILADYRELTSYDHEALDIAISALSKQSASCEQADKKLFGHGYWLMPGEVFISHNVLNEVLDTIIKSMNTEQRKIDSILAKTAENDEAIRTDDHIADNDKMIKLKKRTITERLIITKSLIDSVIADSDNDQFREDTKKIPYKKPEIIYCTECKKCWYSGTVTINGQSYRIFKCSVWERPVSPFGYCYMAERRNDERMGNS